MLPRNRRRPRIQTTQIGDTKRMKQDALSDALTALNNAADKNQDKATIEPASSEIKRVLIQLQQLGYIGVFELVEDGQGGKFKVEIDQAVNECQSIKPRFSVQKDEYSKWAKRYLPARNFGHLIVTTSHGIKTHEEAQNEGVGGKLLAYVY